MPQFKIQTPAGRTLTIEAADQATALAAAQQWHAQQQPGGQRTVAGLVGQSVGAGGSPEYQRARADADAWAAHENPVTRAMGQGGLFGWGDELTGASAATRAAIGNTVGRMMGKEPAYSASDAYRATVDAERAAEAQFSHDHPVGHFAAELLPGLAVAPEGKAAGLLKSMVTGAGLGGVMGGVSGAGNATEGQRMDGAGQGALTGAALGAALPLGAHGVGTVAGKVVRTGSRLANAAAGGKLIDPNKTAAERLADALLKDGVTPQSFGQDAQAWTQSGASSPALMNVGGENTRSLVRAAASQGPARNVAVQHVEQVAQDLQDHAIAAAKGLQPGAQSVPQTAEAIRAARSAQAQQDYPAFRDMPVPIGDDLMSATSGNLGHRYMQNAADLAMAERNPQIATEIANLSDASSQNVSAGALDYIRRGMRDAADTAFNGGSGQLGAALKSRAKDLETALLDVPGFDTARTNYRNHSQQLEALEHGQGILTAPTSDYVAGLSSASPEAQKAAGAGAIQALTDAFARPTQGATGVLNRAATAKAMTDNLSATFGDQPAGNFQSALANELQKLSDARFVSPNTGSQTANKLEDMGLIEPHHLSPHTIILQGLGNLLKGAGLNDAERLAIVNQGLGPAQLGDPLLEALMRKPLPSYAVPAAINGANLGGALMAQPNGQ